MTVFSLLVEMVGVPVQQGMQTPARGSQLQEESRTSTLHLLQCVLLQNALP